jgi:hypothetical protein
MNIDELLDRRAGLEAQNEIPNMKAYADEWNKLGADFQAFGFIANAELCFSKSRHYSEVYRNAEQTAFTRIFGEPCGVVSLRQIGGHQNVYRDGDSVHVPAIPLVIVQNYYPVEVTR